MKRTLSEFLEEQIDKENIDVINLSNYFSRLLDDFRQEVEFDHVVDVERAFDFVRDISEALFAFVEFSEKRVSELREAVFVSFEYLGVFVHVDNQVDVKLVH